MTENDRLTEALIVSCRCTGYGFDQRGAVKQPLTVFGRPAVNGHDSAGQKAPHSPPNLTIPAESTF